MQPIGQSANEDEKPRTKASHPVDQSDDKDVPSKFNYRWIFSRMSIGVGNPTHRIQRGEDISTERVGIPIGNKSESSIPPPSPIDGEDGDRISRAIFEPTITGLSTRIEKNAPFHRTIP